MDLQGMCDGPTPPKNVRLIVDGEAIPVELIYEGRDAWGRHSWKAPVPFHLNPVMHVKLDADEVPEDANISVAFGIEGITHDPRWRRC